MKEKLRKIAVLSIISGMLSCCIIPAHAENSIFYNTGMTRISVRGSGENDTDDKTNVNEDTEEVWSQIEPGIYLVSGAKQMRVTDADNEVLMFKGKLSSDETMAAELPAGGSLEYSGKIYLTAANKAVLEDSESNPAAPTINPFRYSPVKAASFMKLCAGGCVEINCGRVKVYNKNGELTYETYILYEADTTGYILDDGFGAVTQPEQEASGKTFKLNDGQRYVIGTDFDEGEYIAKGSGTVRVYDPEGYIKTVIKLKQAGIPGSDGVESYKFRFGFHNSIIPEGNIEITEIVKKAE